MLTEHQCTRCQTEFELNRKVYLKTGWGRSINADLRPLSKQLEDYQKIVCPHCGHIESDERILSYGLFKPRTVVYLVFVMMGLMLLADLFKL
jgi:DNA-directed RNA polymerase subunit RPC12/RpoP